MLSPSAPSLEGVIPMLVTPFDARGDPDERSLGRLIEHVLDSGVACLAFGGLASESHALSDGERRYLTECVLAHVASRASVLIGVTAESTPLVLGLARHAYQHGAAAVMLAPPAVTQVSAATLSRHYAQVGEAIDLPIMIQDASRYLGGGIGAQVIQQLVQSYPHVKYVKTESVPSGSIIADLRQQLGDTVSIFSGGGGVHLMDDLRAGAAGTIPGCDVPALLVEVYRTFREGQSAEAEALFRRFLPLIVYEMQTLDFGIACQKSLLVYQGIIASAGLRPPARPLSQRDEAELVAKYGSILG